MIKLYLVDLSAITLNIWQLFGVILAGYAMRAAIAERNARRD